MADERAGEAPSLLSTAGEEIVRIIAPVSACMLLVVILVSFLSSSSSSSSSFLPTLFSAIATPSSSSSVWDEVIDAVKSSLLIVAAITVVTFIMVLLFYLRCTRFLKAYMTFSSFLVLALLGGQIFFFLLDSLSIPLDAISFALLLFNFSVVGVLAVFVSRMAIVITQTYLVAIGVLTAFWFTLLPEWTTWALLVFMALYDLAAVLLPGGPLRLLVELAISRNEEIPALVYEARPVEYRPSSTAGVWRQRRSSSAALSPETRLVVADEEEVSAPLMGVAAATGEEEEGEGIGLGSSGAIKLGLGDFIFYSVLVGRAALYDFMTVYACYLAIVAGLGVTLMLLALYRRALPALPVSILLGVLFYVLARFLLEVFVVQCSTNLLMF